MRKPIFIVLIAWSLLASLTTSFAEDEPAIERVDVDVQGWTIIVDKQLQQPEHEVLADDCFKVLEAKLADIKRALPADRIAVLQTYKIALDLEHPKAKTICYHPSAGWLENNGYSTTLAKTVHLPRARQLLTRRNAVEQPWVLLHELAHAYHHQALGYNDKRLKQAFETYKASSRGENTLLFNGKRVRHYALTNEKEFFAEMTEAYFGVNDFFPFNRAELMEHEPAIYRLMRDIWEPPTDGENDPS